MAGRSNSRTYGLVWPLLFVATLAWMLLGLHPFATMCCISLSLFLLIKTHTLIEFRRGSETRPGFLILAAWFFCWPGLDAKAFFHVGDRTETTSVPEVLFAIAKTIFGGLLFFVVAPRGIDVHFLVGGWIGLVGAVFMLHFGSFHVAALFWRSRGRNVRPIMNVPILSTSVSDFWSKRWNLAFRDYAHPFLFKPLARKFSPITAVAVGYLFSGLVHELAISVPAGGGYGLPTLYFTLQGIAILVERKLSKNGWNLQSGGAGWCWTLLVTAPGAFLLFHPPFLRVVVSPVIAAVGALG